ncbi:MAG: hypothetical protein K2M31_09630 [Muribaculaceae bacterium]|nr:hypothetical protein [Muribaculaceae bacterium]
MKKLLTLILGMMIATMAFAYDFENTIFKADLQQPDGRTRSMYLELKPEGKAVMTIKIPGKKIERETNATWKPGRDWITVVSPGDGQILFNIHYDRINGKTVPSLVLDNPYGDAPEYFLISEEQYKNETTAPASSTSKKSSATRKKRK